MQEKLNKTFYLLLILITIAGAYYIFTHLSKTKRVEINLQNYRQLDSCFLQQNYTIATIESKKAVPRIFVKNISSSIKQLKSTEKKSIFIRLMLSNILKANEKLLENRNKILSLQKEKQLSAKDKKWIAEWSEKLRVKDSSFAKLLIKTDVIPPSLAIIQAIVESGYGTSRFAIEGNALFGEHFYGENPKNHIKAKGSKTRMKAFPSIYESIWGYMINLNRHPAYKKLRKLRAIEREKGELISGYQLINTLGSYSENGQSYINNLHKMMRQLQLSKLDSLKLEKTAQEYYYTIKE